MIKIIGTSHVSQQSLHRIDEAFDNYEPDVVCLELDSQRLNSLLADSKDTRNMASLHRALAAFQTYIGSKTGVMPGEEMQYAFEKAQKDGIDIYLIDQDIRQTLGRLKSVRRKEKVKAVTMLPISFLGRGFDYTKIPKQDEIDELLEVFEQKFPELYQVFLEERNLYMAESLRIIESRNPDANILVVVGAAHKTGLERYIDEINSQSSMEKGQQAKLGS